jgi:hypothetical protein
MIKSCYEHGRNAIAYNNERQSCHISGVDLVRVHFGKPAQQMFIFFIVFKIGAFSVDKGQVTSKVIICRVGKFWVLERQSYSRIE